jgi:predicted Fe-Mo cluster-binding NifX family protein
MKIAVTATSPSMNADLDPRFGRCAYFVVFDTTSKESATVPNAHASGSGAGIQAARLVAKLGADHVLTGSCGPNALEALSAAGIGVIEGCSGPVRAAIEDFEGGRLRTDTPPRSAAGDRGEPRGRGGAGGGDPGVGRGGGGGRGRGTGRGRRAGRGQ